MLSIVRSVVGGHQGEMTGKLNQQQSEKRKRTGAVMFQTTCNMQELSERSREEKKKVEFPPTTTATTQDIKPPMCWCRFPAPAKIERMPDRDRINPGRPYWKCPNVGFACTFFQWLPQEIAILLDKPKNQGLKEAISPIKPQQSALSAQIANLKATLTQPERAEPATESTITLIDTTAQIGQTAAKATTTTTQTTGDRSGREILPTQRPYKSSTPIPIPCPPRASRSRHIPSAEDANGC